MFKSYGQCLREAVKIHQDIQHELPSYFWSSSRPHVCFRIMNMCNLTLSISHSPYNSGKFYCETALITTFDDEIIYPSFWQYNDVKLLYKKEELIKEILFIYSKMLHIKYLFLKCIRRWRQRKNASAQIKNFIIRHKDHFMSRPNGLYYRIARTEFYSRVNPAL